MIARSPEREYTLTVKEKISKISPKLDRPNVIGPPEDFHALVQSLRTHQIELELQNEELRKTHLELDALHSRYFDLYDLAPAAYVTVGENGLIAEANLAAAKLLGVARDTLGMYNFSQFIREEDQALYFQKRKLILEEEAQSFELRMAKKDGKEFWAMLEMSAVRKKDGESPHRIVLSDITTRKKAEAVMAARSRLLLLIASSTSADLLRATIDEAETLTGSEVGFFHLVEADQVTLTLQAYSTNTTRNMCQATGVGLHYPIDQAGVWVECVRQRRPVIHNDYPALPHRKGLPMGHARIDRELVVPIMRGDSIVALLGVGNKKWDYDDHDIEAVLSLADLSWEIAEYKLKDEALKKSFKENKSLLAELQHRVKNSFTMICSMINLASGNGVSSDTKAVLSVLDSRVRSVSELYSLLYASGSFSELRLDQYCARIAAPLVSLAGSIELETELDSLFLPAKMAAPIGLILTELITNAIKYAFPEGGPGTITVALKRTGTGARLEVGDGGVGLPEGFELFKNAGMGFNLVQGLTAQIEGKFKIERGTSGTRCTVDFSLVD